MGEMEKISDVDAPAVTSGRPGLLERAVERALRFDRASQLGYIQGLRSRHPRESPSQLADRIILRARWWGAGYGFVTGGLANPWFAVPAAITDARLMLQKETQLAVRIALLYDPGFLDDDEPPYELLVPILGFRAASEALRGLAARGAMGVTRRAIKKVLGEGASVAFKGIMLKYFGLKVTERGVVKGTLPVVGGLVGGVWNHREISVVGNRVRRYFEGQEITETDGTGGYLHAAEAGDESERIVEGSHR